MAAPVAVHSGQAKGALLAGPLEQEAPQMAVGRRASAYQPEAAMGPQVEAELGARGGLLVERLEPEAPAVVRMAATHRSSLPRGLPRIPVAC